MVANNSFRLAQRQVRLVVLRIVFLSLSILLIPLPGRSLYAQTATTGALSGTVRDASGAFVAGAMVKIVNLGSGEERNLVTDGKGRLCGRIPPSGPVPDRDLTSGVQDRRPGTGHRSGHGVGA